jgi:hypothetical protein
MPQWVIAHELVQVIKGKVSTDWMQRDSARAKIRVHVKRLLRKYGNPPDLQDAAVQNVLRQAEALSAEWAARMHASMSLATSRRRVRPHVRLSMGRPVSQYAGNEGCAG